MYKIILIPALLLLFFIQANNFLLANESVELKIDEGAEAVAEAGVKAEEKVGETAATVSEIESKVEDAAAVVEDADAKVKESVSPVVETGKKIEEAVESTESKSKISQAVEAVGAKVEAGVEKSETALKEGGTKVDENAAAVVEVEEKVEETKASAVADETKPEESSGAVEESENDVIATVNDEKIIRKDFDKRLNVFRRLNSDVTRPIKLQVIDQLTKRLLLKQFVEGQNIEVGEDEVQGELGKNKVFFEK